MAEVFRVKGRNKIYHTLQGVLGVVRGDLEKAEVGQFDWKPLTVERLNQQTIYVIVNVENGEYYTGRYDDFTKFLRYAKHYRTTPDWKISSLKYSHHWAKNMNLAVKAFNISISEVE